MEFVLILRELAGRWRIVAIGAAVALVVAVFSVYRLDGFGLKPRSLVHSSASTQVLVDSESSVLGNVEQSFEPLASRATVYANFMTSPAVLNVIAHRVGLSGEQLYAAGPVSLDEPRVEQEPTALKRNVQITGETKPYRVGFESQTNLPTITINTQAPTTAKAVALANAAAVGMEEYVWGSENTNNVPAGSRVIVRQLGPAHGAVDDPSIRKSMLALVFVAILLLWCAAMLIVPRLRKMWRESAAVEGLVGGASASGDPAGAPANGAVSANGATAAYDVASGNGATAANGATAGNGATAVVIDDQVSNGDRTQTHGNGATPVVVDDQVSNGDHAPELADASELAPIETAVESPGDDNVVEGPPYRKKGGRTAVSARSGR